METDMPPPAPQAPKTNADFRRMLETPRTDRSEDGAPGGARMRRQKAGGEPGEAKKKSRRPKPVAEDGEGDAVVEELVRKHTCWVCAQKSMA